jgi:hypothetical protein
MSYAAINFLMKNSHSGLPYGKARIDDPKIASVSVRTASAKNDDQA